MPPLIPLSLPITPTHFQHSEQPNRPTASTPRHKITVSAVWPGTDLAFDVSAGLQSIHHDLTASSWKVFS